MERVTAGNLMQRCRTAYSGRLLVAGGLSRAGTRLATLAGAAVLTLLYAFFRVVTELAASWLTPPDGFLRAGGFRLSARRVANFGLVHSDLWCRTSVKGDSTRVSAVKGFNSGG